MNNNQTQNEIIEDIKSAEQEIITQLGFEDASEDKKKEVLETLDKRVAIAITKVVLENFTPEEAEEMRLALEQNGNLQSRISEILYKNPSLQEEIRKALLALWKKIKQEAEASRS